MILLIMLIVVLIFAASIVFFELMHSRRIKKKVFESFGNRLTIKEKKRMIKSIQSIYCNAKVLSDYCYRELKNNVRYYYGDETFETNLVNGIVGITAVQVSLIAAAMAIVSVLPEKSELKQKISNALAGVSTDLFYNISILALIFVILFTVYGSHLYISNRRKSFLKKFSVAIDQIETEGGIKEYPSAALYPARSASGGRRRC
ncbi:hypothetical protein [Paenibacillus pinihumi]|uniref:hypothetical protein n=1 Tax=Paenibacillus pinihumi TaxID=669462 RepID=UPI0012B5888A|nr:hypothetical protein [Paenibacillus pinihumi]